MSSRLGGLAAAGLFAATVPCAGQSVAALRAEADSLAREWRQANAMADLQDSLRQLGARAGRDTVRVGGLTVLVNPSPLPVAEAAGRVWAEIERLYGPAAGRVTAQPIVIEAVDPDTAIPPPPLGTAVQLPWNLGVAALAQWLLNFVSAGATDPGLREWLGGPLLFDTAAAARDAPHLHVELVTRPWHTVRRCFLGDLRACRIALSVGDTTALLARWYDAAERRALVVDDYQGYFNRGATHDEFLTCAAGRAPACLHLLEGLPPHSLVPLLDYRSRLSLVALALQSGDRGAVGRLLADPTQPIAQRLSAASGVSVDTLTARWLRRIRAARPKPVSLPPWGAWVAFGWIGIFATCGLRSSRWRAS